MNKLRILIILMLVATMAVAHGAFVTAAGSDEPTYGTATVDGDSSEWDLTNDFFAEMYEAGKLDKDVLSKLYLRYDCSTGTLYALVLPEPGQDIQATADDNFIKLGQNSKLVDGGSPYYPSDGTPPDFEWIGLSGVVAEGWEASTPLPPEDYENLNVHAQIVPGRTSAVAGRAIDLKIDCPEMGAITIVKVAEPEWDQDFNFTGDLGSFSLNDDGIGTENIITVDVLTGVEYTVTEAVTGGWDLNSIACSGDGTWDPLDRSVSITVDSQDSEVMCFFFNEALPGAIEIEKILDYELPESLTTEFGFTLQQDSIELESFALAHEETESFIELEPGTYSVTEDDPALLGKFGLKNLSCDDPDSETDTYAREATIYLDPGETVHCTFTNEEEPPDAVTLASFTAKAGVGAVNLSWETGTEIDNAGFNLYRAAAEGGPYTKVNAALIAAQGDAVSGASYSYLDQRLQAGTYFYKLEDVDLSGVVTTHGPVSATVLARFRRPAYRPTWPGR